MIWNTSELYAWHLSHATANFVIDCCQYGPSWIFGLKMELIACASLVGGTTEQNSHFPHRIWYYQWYELLLKFLHSTSTLPQPFLLLIGANLAQAGYLGWKWSVWHVPDWLAVAVFLLTLYDGINDMKKSQTVCITPQPCHSHFCCWWLPIWP